MELGQPRIDSIVNRNRGCLLSERQFHEFFGGQEDRCAKR